MHNLNPALDFLGAGSYYHYTELGDGRITRRRAEGAGAATMTTAKKLARQLYRDDLSRANEVPVATDGYRAYDGWLRASSDAGDTETREALESVDRNEFAAAWEECADGKIPTVRVYESDGSDGYSAGTWGVVVTLDTDCSGDGGFPSRALAAARGKQLAASHIAAGNPPATR